MYLAYRILSTTATLTAALTGCDQQNNSVSLGFSQDGPFSGAPSDVHHSVSVATSGSNPPPSSQGGAIRAKYRLSRMAPSGRALLLCTLLKVKP